MPNENNDRPGVIWSDGEDCIWTARKEHPDDRPYLRCDIDPGDAVVIDKQIYGDIVRAEIRATRAMGDLQTRIAALEARDEQVWELVEAVGVLLNSGEKMHNPYYSDRVWQNLHDAYEAAKLKEQQDER